MLENKIKEKKSQAQVRHNLKMPSKIFYNLDHMLSPKGGDPITNIYLGASDKNRISRDR